jgi:hypothetical protein
LVFVSDVNYTVDLLEYPGGITECDQLAGEAGLPGTYLPWLSNGGYGSPNTVFYKSTGPYHLVDGTKIADNYTDLTDGSLDAAIDKTASGVSRGNVNVFTGTFYAGTAAADHTCDGWTSAAISKFAVGGTTGASDLRWSDTWDANDSLLACDIAAAIYCFQQSATTPE